MSLTPDQIQLSAKLTINKNRMEYNLNEMRKSLTKFASCLKDIHTTKCWELRDNPYDSFEDFTRKELGISQVRAYQIMQAQDIKLALCDASKDEPTVLPVVEAMSERSIRELSNVEPSKAVQVITEIVSEGKKPTAKAIRDKVLPGKVKEAVKHVCPSCGTSF